MKKIEEESRENNERWLLTYSDLITLLMIFFVVLYAMSNIDARKYSQLAKSLGVAMGGGKNIIGTDTPGSIEQKPVTEVEQLNEFKEMKDEVDKYLNENNLTENVETMITDRGLLIRFKNSLLFDSGKADIRLDTRSEIIKIGSILSKVNGYIRVEGHTDNVPMSNREFKSNWQLSAVRATNVAELLIKECGIAPDKVAAIGYGEYRPVGDNNTPEGRSKNRRVDIVIINSKYNDLENIKK